MVIWAGVCDKDGFTGNCDLLRVPNQNPEAYSYKLNGAIRIITNDRTLSIKQTTTMTFLNPMNQSTRVKQKHNKNGTLQPDPPPSSLFVKAVYRINAKVCMERRPLEFWSSDRASVTAWNHCTTPSWRKATLVYLSPSLC